MSRHRYAYDKDELYDDYDEEEEYYDEEGEYANQAAYQQEAEAANEEYEYNYSNLEENVAFILESLNGASGLKKYKVNESTVRKMLEMYDYDPDKTLDYFIKQKAGETKPTSSTATAKPKTSTASAAQAVKKAEPVVSKPTALTQATEGKKPQDSMKSDLDALGFKLDVKELSSDDELDASDITSVKSDALPHLTVVVAGHVDAGKSTLIGSLLTKAKQLVESSTSRKKQDEIPLAWMTDESQSEREHGVTIDIAERKFQTQHRTFTILDSPGHRDFIPNMISGASEADAAILVVPGSENEYESAIGEKAQTREHAVLLKALGVNQVIVVVSKLEGANPAWSEERFLAIERDIRSILIGLTFRNEAITVIPVSGLLGENVEAISQSCPLKTWYSGPSLINCLDVLKVPPRPISKPLKAVLTSSQAECIQESKVYDVKIKILQGRIRLNRSINLTMHPHAWRVTRIIDSEGASVSEIRAGLSGVARLSLVSPPSKDSPPITFSLGQVISKGKDIGRVVTAFKATIVTMEGVHPILAGSSFELYLMGEEVECQITKLYRLKSKDKGVVKYPKCIGAKKTGSVRIETTRPVNIEVAANCKSLGRFALRSRGRICAVGLCSQLPSYTSSSSLYNVTPETHKLSS